MSKMDKKQEAEIAKVIQSHNAAVIQEARTKIRELEELAVSMKQVTVEQGELTEGLKQVAVNAKHQFNNLVDSRLPEGDRDPIG